MLLKKNKLIDPDCLLSKRGKVGMKTFCRLPGLLHTSPLIALTRPQDTHQYRLKSDGRISCILLSSAKIVFSLADNKKIWLSFCFFIVLISFSSASRRPQCYKCVPRTDSLLLAGCQF